MISITELSQLLKFPSLVEHYIEHKAKDNNLALFQFLSMHYTASNKKDADDEKDQKLPFKSHNGCINNTSVEYVLANFSVISIKPVYVEKKSYSIYSENFLSAIYLSSIWQPPKSC